MKKIIVCLAILLYAGSAFAGDGQFDRYGGWSGLKGSRTGAFHTEQINGRWWLITPEGNVFWSVGMYCVRIGGIPETGTERRPYRDNCLKKHVSEQEWARVTRKRLYEWGFNTIGDWSSESIYREPGFAYVIGINLPGEAENVIPKGSYGYFPDVFSPEFKESVQKRMQDVFKNQPYLIDDPQLLGYFLADEPAWYGSKGRRGALADDFIALDDSKPGKKAWLEFIKQRYPSGEVAPNEQDKLDFLQVIAEQFSRVLSEGLREFDRHHMILGTRPTRTYPEVVRGIGKYADVFSMGAYDLNQGYQLDPKFDEIINEVYQNAQKPILLGVLIAAQDSGLPYGIVRTQRDRGISYWRHLAKAARHPAVVGIHWFQYFDPPLKCYDQRAANWGLVNDKDEPYEDAVSLIAQANKMVYAYALGLASFVPEFDKFLAPRKEAPNPDGQKQQAEKPQARGVEIPLANAGFEEGSAKWGLQAWQGKSKASIDYFEKHTGRASLKIQGGPADGWGSVGVGVQGAPGITLKPGYQYRLSAWVKTKGVENFAFVRFKVKYESGDEAYFGTEGLYGDNDWKQVEVIFSPREENKVEYLAAQLVGKGIAWFDDLKLDLLE
mgnify:CR=1 FL=1